MARFVFYLVHGTQFYWLRKPKIEWIQPGSMFRAQLLEELRGAGHDAEFRLIEWTGRNRQRHRLDAALQLAEEVGVRGEHEFQVLVGHSHGGNVCLLALKDDAVRQRIDGVVCLSTPFLLFWKAEWALKLLILSFASWLLATTALVNWSLGGHWAAIPVGMALILAVVIPLTYIFVVNPVRSFDLEANTLPLVSKPPLMIARCPGDEASGVLGFVQLMARLIFTVEARIGGFWRLLSERLILGAAIVSLAILTLVIGAIYLEGFPFVPILVWAGGLVLIGPILFGMPLRMLIYGLSFGWDLAALTVTYSMSAEATPFGSWRTLLVRPNSGEEVPKPAHSETYQHGEVISAVAEWAAELGR